MKKTYIKTQRENMKTMSNAELLEGFTVVCNAICNAHNFTRHGPNMAMREDYASYHDEIISRMRGV